MTHTDPHTVTVHPHGHADELRIWWAYILVGDPKFSHRGVFDESTVETAR